VAFSVFSSCDLKLKGTIVVFQEVRLCAAKLEQGEVPLFDMRPAELLLELGKKQSVFNNTAEHIEDRTEKNEKYADF
jgi:hypothetical protein